MNKDELRLEFVRLSLAIETTTCPETKTRLLKRARVLLANSEKSSTKEARSRIERLQNSIPKVFRDNPDGLRAIEEKQAGYEKLIPYIAELKTGQRIQDKIKSLASQFKLEIAPTGANKKAKQRHTDTRRKKGDKHLLSKSNKDYCEKKFKRLQTLNNVTDNKEIPIEMRRAFAKGKRELVKNETQFNGRGRNDKPTNTRDSWNENSKPLASAKGAR